MAMLREFREFAVRGNVMDLAVGVIIGAAFGKIVDSVVGDLIMPVVGRVLGGLDFGNFFIPLTQVPAGVPETLEAVRKAGVPVFAYGSFVTILINFVILAFIIFLLVRWINKLRREVPPAPAAVVEPEDTRLLREIRDALRQSS
jgi:large conductance mechanosensitive channel